jgi:hypothetical protein
LFSSQNAQSAQYCFKFYVSENGVCSCPGDPCITTTTTTTTTTSTLVKEKNLLIIFIRLNLFIEQHLCQQLLLLQKVQRKNIFLNIYVDKHKTNCDILILAASMNWPLVGSIIGLVFLGALTLISYLCWRYCWFVSFEIMCYY